MTFMGGRSRGALLGDGRRRAPLKGRAPSAPLNRLGGRAVPRWAMARLPSDEVASAVRAKRCVFTLTAGRSGSNYLQQLFAHLPGTRSEHEPEPGFVHVLRRAQHNPEAAHRFWLDVKLPHIAKLP